MDFVDPNTLIDEDEITAVLAYDAEQYAVWSVVQRAGRLLTFDEWRLIAHIQALLERRRVIRHALKSS